MMDDQNFQLIMNAIEGVKTTVQEFKVETKGAIDKLSDRVESVEKRLTKVEDRLNSKQYFWDTAGKILAGGASTAAIIAVVLKIIGVI